MITHTNRKGDAYYLHQGERKSGSVHYYFSKTPNPETAVTVMPDGYEIHEKPISGQVFSSKIHEIKHHR